MDRKEFLSSIGITASSLFLLTCLGCSKATDNPGVSGTTTGSSGVDFTIDLSNASNSALLNKGGFLISNGVIVAHATSGAYIAAQESCTHENYPLVYDAASQHYFCNNHGSAFTETGAVLNSPANRNLTIYKTSLTGSSLRIFS